jgi:hypothetical protein|tara:strand:- start:897 stop:1061 length:165 start_codon:yes stop_codon:yes gene_type:complete
VKVRDLIYDPDSERHGIVIGWVRIGGPDPAVYEILYEDGEIDLAIEDLVEVINE